jgi:hypothetical protein
MGADPKKEEKGSAWISDAVALRKKRRRRWGLLCVVAEGEVEPETGLPFFLFEGGRMGTWPVRIPRKTEDAPL